MCTVSPGQVLRQLLLGSIKMRCTLAGKPVYLRIANQLIGDTGTDCLQMSV